jgi:uncharacterized coiled-coil protein SlyX
MLNYQEITLLVIAAVIFGSTVIIGVVFPYLNKKGINAKAILDDVQKGLEEVKTGLEVVKEVAPSTQLDILSIVEKYAEIGVEKAQQLYISSQLQGSDRKASAKETIVNTLKELNIPVTDNLDKLIDDIIESKVFSSKTDVEINIQERKATQDTITDLQKQLADLQVTKATLTQSNADLINKLNTVQSAIATNISAVAQ